MVKKKAIKPKKKHPGGRPNLFKNEKVKAEILLHIENGNSYRDACILAGVSESTFQNWTKQGRDDIKDGKDTKFVEFLAKVDQAKIKYKAWLIQNVNTAALTDGKLSLEVLARKYEEFRRKDNLKIDANVTGNLGITMADIHAAAKEMEEEEEAQK